MLGKFCISLSLFLHYTPAFLPWSEVASNVIKKPLVTPIHETILLNVKSLFLNKQISFIKIKHQFRRQNCILLVS